MAEQTISLRLSRDEALVFFEWLASLEQRGSSAYIEEAEWRVIWSLEGQIERTLAEVLAPSYADLLAKAKLDITKEKEAIRKSKFALNC